MDKNQNIYRVIFHNHGEIIELYARSIYQGDMYAFVEVAEIIFGERSQLVVDPSDEKLKSEFSGVKRTFIPINAIVRIDEVEKVGTNKIRQSDGKSSSNVKPFIMPPNK